jgi:replicative DNA helicase
MDSPQDTPFEQELDISQLLPPHSIEAEQSVIGGLLLANDKIHEIRDKVAADDFYRDDHKQIFRAIELLDKDSFPIDVVTLANKLKDLEVLERVGGLPYLAELAENTPSSANIQAYAKVVQERALSRKLLITANLIEQITRNPEGRSSEEIIAEAENELRKINEARAKDGGLQHVDPILKNAVNQIEEMVANQGKLAGLTTGFTQLDEITNGLKKTDLIIVAARPAMGKTSFAMNLIEAAILKNEDPKPAVVFSMEMSAEQLMLRLISANGHIHAGRISKGTLEDDDWPRLTTTMTRLKGKPLFIDDTPALTPNELKSRVHRIHNEYGGIGIVMVDYLQLMQVSGRSEGRTAEISEISRSLKALAKEYKCPVVALSQLNRSLEQRPNKRPIMSDLRESGAIEQDADIIMFLYRDEYYNEDSEDQGIAEVILGKHRAGETGTVKLAFIGHQTRFDNLALDDYQNDGY